MPKRPPIYRYLVMNSACPSLIVEAFTTTLATSFLLGISNIAERSAFSIMDRRPRAPVFLSLSHFGCFFDAASGSTSRTTPFQFEQSCVLLQDRILRFGSECESALLRLGHPTLQSPGDVRPTQESSRSELDP